MRKPEDILIYTVLLLKFLITDDVSRRETKTVAVVAAGRRPIVVDIANAVRAVVVARTFPWITVTICGCIAQIHDTRSIASIITIRKVLTLSTLCS